MPIKLLWVVETPNCVKGFETQSEAIAFEKSQQSRERLLNLIYSCQSREDFYLDDFLEFFEGHDDAQMLVDYLQSLIDKGKPSSGTNFLSIKP